VFFRSNREGSHADNDASDPWINTVTSIESIVARSGYPNDRDGKLPPLDQFSSSPPKSMATSSARSPTNGNASSDFELSKSPPKESSFAAATSPTKQTDGVNRRLQPSPSRAADLAAIRRSLVVDEPERERDRDRDREPVQQQQAHRSRGDKLPAPPVPSNVKDLSRHNGDEPDTKHHHQRRVKNAVPTIISPLLSDVMNNFNYFCYLV